MNEIKIIVRFKEHECYFENEKDIKSLISGDYNSTKLVFDFDREDGTKVFEMKNENNEIVYADEIDNNELILVGKDENDNNCTLFNTKGTYAFEITLYGNDSKLTSVHGAFSVQQEEVVISDDVAESHLPIFDEMINSLEDALSEVETIDIDVEKVDSSTTVTLTKKDGTTKEVEILDGVDGIDGQDGRNGTDGQDGITPTIGNNGNWYLGETDTGKPSRGIQGETGAPGQNGQDGYTPQKGVDYFTPEDIESLNIPDEPAKVGDIFSITTSSTSEQIFNAFGGVDEFEKVLNASKKGELYLNATVKPIAGFLRGKITRTLIQAYYMPFFDDSEILSLAFIPNVGLSDDGAIDKLEDLKIKIYRFSYYKEEDNNPASISCTSVEELGFTNVVYYISGGICDLTTYSSSSQISKVINLSEIIDDRLSNIPKIYMFNNDWSTDNNSLLGLGVYPISYPSDTRVLIKYINSNNKLVDIVFNYNPNTGVSSVYSKNEYNIDGSTKQDIEDNSLDTIHKTIPTAINEVNSIAKGANQALSYSNYQSMITTFNTLANNVYKAGQNVMIVTLQVPDLWISGIESTDVPYTYTSDSDFTNALATNGYVQVGYYKLSALETQKVDLTNYVTNTDYANTSRAGVIKSSSTYATNVASGVLQSATKTYSDYTSGNNNMFISKGTLENVFTGKGFITSHQDITGKEDKSNKVTSISANSTDTEYPSAKAVYDYIQSLDGDEVSY